MKISFTIVDLKIAKFGTFSMLIFSQFLKYTNLRKLILATSFFSKTLEIIWMTLGYSIDGGAVADIGARLDFSSFSYFIGMWVYLYQNTLNQMFFCIPVVGKFYFANSVCTGSSNCEVLWCLFYRYISSSTVYVDSSVKFLLNNGSTTSITNYMNFTQLISGWIFIGWGVTPYNSSGGTLPSNPFKLYIYTSWTATSKSHSHFYSILRLWFNFHIIEFWRMIMSITLISSQRHMEISRSLI